MAYRISRNIEASFIQYIKEQVDIDWTNISVEKSFAKIYDDDVKLPIICVRCGITDHKIGELGNDATVRTPQVFVDLFCKSDGQRLDLKDYLIRKLKYGINYYEYTIVNGQIQSKVQNGRIRVLSFTDVPVDFGEDKAESNVKDRFRHALTLTCSLGKLES